MAEMIIDLIVFRVLIFNQLKNKTIIKQDLCKLRLISNIPSVTYDGILIMAQKIIRTFRLFINEDTAVHDLVRTISGCIKNSGADYAQKSADFFSIMSSKVVQFKQAQEHSFNSMSRQDQNLRIFAIVEMYCRTLQDDLRQAFNVTGQSLSITSAQPQQPTYPSGSALKTYHPSTSYTSPSYRSRPRQFKRLNVHSLSSSPGSPLTLTLVRPF
jgi:hypothetical protein